MKKYLSILREINEHSRRNYFDIIQANHLLFLEHCNKSLFEFFNSLLEGNLVFSTIAYKSNKRKTFEIVQGNDRITGYNFPAHIDIDLKKQLKKLLIESQDIKKKSIINLTNILLKENLGYDLFFVNDPDDYKEILDSSIRNPARIKIFPLGSLIYDNNIDEFEAVNREEIRNFISTIQNPDFPNTRQYSRYLWHYKNLENKVKGHNNDKFYIHFIRPAVIEFDYNLLLALATKRRLKEHELGFIDLLIFRIVSQTTIDNVRRDEEIERLKNISATTHVIKTTTNGLLGPPLNSLLQEDIVDPRILDISSAKEKILKYTDTINLITKLLTIEANDPNFKTKINELLDENFYFTNKTFKIDVPKIRDEILKSFKNDPSGHTLIFEDIISESEPDFMTYDKYKLSESFYEFLLLTIIENVIKHGESDIDGNYKLKMEIDSEFIRFTNRPKAGTKKELNTNDMTGNFRVLLVILQNMKIAHLNIEKNHTKFSIELTPYYDE